MGNGEFRIFLKAQYKIHRHLVIIDVLMEVPQLDPLSYMMHGLWRCNRHLGNSMGWDMVCNGNIFTCQVRIGGSGCLNLWRLHCSGPWARSMAGCTGCCSCRGCNSSRRRGFHVSTMTLAKILDAEVAGLPLLWDALDAAWDTSSSSLLSEKFSSSNLGVSSVTLVVEVLFLLLETWILGDMVEGVIRNEFVKKWFFALLAGATDDWIMLLYFLHDACTAVATSWL